jgi:hypothetical protein
MNPLAGGVRMQTVLFILAAVLLMTVPPAFAAGKDSAAPKSKPVPSDIVHEEIVDGVKATFKIETMAAAMKSMGMVLPKGVKETHHISVELRDAKSGRLFTEGEAKVKIQAPDKSEQIKDLLAMVGHFGADLTLAEKGRYGIMCKFKPKGGKVGLARFWYQVR